jgi:hypothetical protein
MLGWKWEKMVLVALAVALFAGCSSQSPESLAQQAKNLGVYARADNSFRVLTVFGVENDDSGWTRFMFTESIPKAQAVSYFVVNVPDAKISDSQLFLLPNALAAKWVLERPTDPRNPKPLKATIEPLSATVYKVSLAEPSAKTSKGFLCLWLKMPMGTADRLYAIQVGG